MGILPNKTPRQHLEDLKKEIEYLKSQKSVAQLQFKGVEAGDSIGQAVNRDDVPEEIGDDLSFDEITKIVNDIKAAAAHMSKSPDLLPNEESLPLRRERKRSIPHTDEIIELPDEEPLQLRKEPKGSIPHRDEVVILPDEELLQVRREPTGSIPHREEVVTFPDEEPILPRREPTGLVLHADEIVELPDEPYHNSTLLSAGEPTQLYATNTPLSGTTDEIRLNRVRKRKNSKELKDRTPIMHNQFGFYASLAEELSTNLGIQIYTETEALPNVTNIIGLYALNHGGGRFETSSLNYQEYENFRKKILNTDGGIYV
jgi:hypothetical protein